MTDEFKPDWVNYRQGLADGRAEALAEISALFHQQKGATKMGNCATYYDEIRFSVRKPDTTEMWVYIRGEGDCPHMLLGWHYKAFPSTMTTLDILQAWLTGVENPMIWPRMDPPPTVKNYDPDFDELEARILELMARRGNDKP